MKLNTALRIVWEETTRPLGSIGDPAQNRRYVARSLTGGSSWGVYDKLEERFLLDREIRGIDPREPLEVIQ